MMLTSTSSIQPICNFDIFANINPSNLNVKTIHKIKFYIWVGSTTISNFSLKGCNYNINESTTNTCNLSSDSNIMSIPGGQSYEFNNIKFEEIILRNDNGLIKASLNNNVYKLNFIFRKLH